MNAKKLVIGIVVGTIVAFILGYLIFDLAAANFYAAHMGSATGLVREPQQIWAVVIGTAAYAALITGALNSGSGAPTIVGGLKAGALVGFLVWLTADFIFLGIMNVNTLTLAIVDPLLEAIRAGITGAVIAAVVAKL